MEIAASASGDILTESFTPTSSKMMVRDTVADANSQEEVPATTTTTVRAPRSLRDTYNENILMHNENLKLQKEVLQLQKAYYQRKLERL